MSSTLRGSYLHQKTYTEAFLEEYKDLTPRGREPQQENPSILTKMPNPLDMANPEHVEWVQRAQKIQGAHIWLSDRTRPQIACAVSMAAQSLRFILDHLKIRLRHLRPRSQHHQDLWSTLDLSTEGEAMQLFLSSQSLQTHPLLHLEKDHREVMSSCCHVEMCVTSSSGIVQGT